MIYLGDKKAGTVYLGDKKLSKIYLGEKLVWEGYPEGHIIGTFPYANQAFSVYVINGNGNQIINKTKSDANKKFDYDFTGSDFNGKLSMEQSYLFQNRSEFVSIISMNITLAQNLEYTQVRDLFHTDSNLTYVDINSIKLALHESNTSGTVNFYYSFNDCKDLETIKAGRFPWGKIGLFYYCFRNLPALKLLDLSGADLSHIQSSSYQDSFYNIGVVGCVVKLTGCNDATKTAVLQALKKYDGNNFGHTWELSGDTITRTA